MQTNALRPAGARVIARPGGLVLGGDQNLRPRDVGAKTRVTFGLGTGSGGGGWFSVLSR